MTAALLRSAASSDAAISRGEDRPGGVVESTLTRLR
ncbi:hypothetical protein FHR33_001915 [Nonomuraea dietziae]|uniref:Uncharacterized protein n=1 Tax=Nonomuraea dietziae TaxID=65515 RepID=A0A7W5V6Q9_9ACTN|nr:hypothetical protein [Nonomuraea dietziae]